MNTKHQMNKAEAATAQVAQHTPTPWESTPGIGCGVLYNIGPADTRPVLGVFHAPDKKQPILIAQANAEFIVRACNCHEELLEALKALVNDWGLDETVMEGNWERAKAALAKAEGKL